MRIETPILELGLALFLSPPCYGVSLLGDKRAYIETVGREKGLPYSKLKHTTLPSFTSEVLTGHRITGREAQRQSSS